MNISAAGAAPAAPFNLAGSLATGAAITGGTALALGKTLSFPAPAGLLFGAVVGVPMAAIMYTNRDGAPNAAWQSALMAGAPAAVAGAAIGAFGGAFEGKALGPAVGGALLLGAVGVGIGTLAHALTRP